MDRTGVGTVCVWIWAVIFVVNGQNYVNVARGKTYMQSSKLNYQYPSSNAANGDTGGTFSSTNCIHTTWNGDLNPWWEVDLGQPYPVYNIDLWARGGYKPRLYPSVITVDNETCAEVTTFPSDTRKRTVTCSAIMKGQTVRITRQGNTGEDNAARTLNMCEMEIYGCLDNYYRRSDNSRCIRCTWSCKPGTVCDEFTGFCPRCPPGKQGHYCQDEDSDGGISTNALIGSVIGGALILGICIILGFIILKRRSARPEETRQNNQASNDLNLSPTSPRPEAPGDRQERTTVFQEQEPTYEIAEDRAKATKPSVISDTVYQQSEADSANPYDLPTEQYHNTGDVHLYGH